MKQFIIQLLKRILPRPLVRIIREKRKEQRQQKRFAINEGKDLLQNVEVLGISFSIYLNPFLNGGVDSVIYKDGVWEPEIVYLIKKHLPPRGTFVDIGANIGFHSLIASAVTGPDGNVLAFEPLPRLQQQMQKSIESNNFSNIVIKPVALGMSYGSANLSLVEENIGASSIQDVSIDRVVSDIVTVPVRTLDSYREELSRIDLVKIDIEGTEYEALRGGEKILLKFKPVIILEFSPHVYEKDFTGKSLVLYEYLKGLGYTITDIGNRFTDVEKNLRNGEFKGLHTNLLCIPV